MGSWTAERSRRAVALAVVILGLVVVACNSEQLDSDPTPLQQVLREIEPDGHWSEETALRAFSAVFGPLPGVEVPEGPEAEVEFGTIAIRMLSLYIDEITPEQREAALNAAGPLARFLDPDAGPAAISRPVRPTVALGIDPATIVAADADDYEAEIKNIVTGIESRIGRPLGIEFEVVVSPNPVGILHATANPTTEDGENITGCEITVLPNAQALSGKNLTAVLAHETWHCFEYSRLGTMSRRKSSPPWIMEGQAMWVGEAFVGGSSGLEPADRHWKEYLIDPGPGKGLFGRSYDAIGFYSHIHDQGINPWIVLDPILDQTSNVSAYNTAVGGKSLDVVTTWAPSWYRDSKPTSTFALVHAPGIPGQDVRPSPSTFTISNGTFQQVTALAPLSAAISDVMVEAEILNIDVSGQGIIGDMMFGAEIVFVSNARSFCMVEDCTCPDGAPGPTEHLGEELRVAMTGDALTGSDAFLRGWSIAEWCSRDESDQAAPPVGSAGGPGTPCEMGCGSSNGDPHLTTIDGRSYDFQAAGEFVMLRSQDVEIQARQEPYQGSTSVTINTAIAVSADGGRAAVYADPTGLRLLVDGTELPLDEPAVAGGLQITAIDDGFQIETDDGTTVYVLGLGQWGLNLLVAPSPDMNDEGTGLLSATGDGPLPALPDGSDVDVAADFRAALYTDLADAWAVTGDTTLFDYPDGDGPETYRDRSIPELGAPLDFFDLSEALQDAGLGQCGSITDAALLLQCAFDVALTEDPGFVASYESVDVLVTAGAATVPSDEEGGAACPTDELCEIQVALSEIPLEVDGASITIDGNGTGWVTSPGAGVVLEVDLDGGVVRRTIETEEGAIDLAVGEGALWVVVNEFGTGKLVRIDPVTGETLAEVDPGVSGGPRSVAVGEGAVWTVLDGYGRVGRVDPEDNSATVVDVDTRFVGGGVETPLVVAHGLVWAVDASKGAVTRIDPAGQPVDVIEGLGYSASTSGDTTSILARGPVGLAGSDDGVWVLSEVNVEEEGSNVQRGSLFLLDPESGEVVREVDLIFAPAHARPGLALTDDAAWYVSFVDSYVVRVDLDTGRQTFVRPPGFGALAQGVATDGSTVYFITEGSFDNPGGVYGIDPREAAAASG